MDTLQAYQTVAAIEADYPVENLQLGGLCWWPVLRFLVYARVAEYRHKAYSAVVGTESHSRVQANGQTDGSERSPQPKFQSHSIEAAEIIESDPEKPRWADAKKTDFLLFSLAVDYRQRREQGLYDQYLDPLIDHYGKDYSFEKLTVFDIPALGEGTHYPSFWLNHHLSRHEFYRHWPNQDAFLAQVDDLNQWLSERKIDLSYAPLSLLFRIKTILLKTERFIPILQHLSPRAAFFQSYVNIEKQPLVLACKALGIQTVEIQHGFLDACCPFSDMATVATHASEFLPDHFWCWGKPTQNALSKQLSTSLWSPNIYSTILRRLWGLLKASTLPWSPNVCSTGKIIPKTAVPSPACTSQESPSQNHPIQQRISKAEKVILIAHQPDLVIQDEELHLLPKHLTDAIAQSPSSWLWLLRLHPRSAHLTPQYRAFLDQSGAGVCNVEEATQLPLLDLLPHCHAVLTSWSTLAFEATDLHIPVGIIDPVGLAVFGDHIASGVMTPLANRKQMAANMKDLLSPQSRPSLSYSKPFDEAQVGQLLAQL